METVGEKIYNLRKAKGVSQEELAFALDTSRQTVSRWETDSVKPTFANLESLCKFFNVSNNYFLSDEEIGTVINETVQTKEIAASNDNWKSIVFAISVVLLVLCIIACGFAAYATITPVNTIGLNIRIINRFKYVGVVCIIIGALALAMLIFLFILFIKNKKKTKCNTLSGKM